MKLMRYLSLENEHFKIVACKEPPLLPLHFKVMQPAQLRMAV